MNGKSPLKAIHLILIALIFLSGFFPARELTAKKIHAAKPLESKIYELTDSETAVIKAVRDVKPAVVGIKTFRGEQTQTPTEVASGVIFRPDGYILTNAHVLRYANHLLVYTTDGKTHEAALVAPSDEYDLAVLKISATHLPVVKFGNSDLLELGQTAIAIGNPLSFGWTVTKGVVSALNREVLVKHVSYRNLIQTDAAINPGNSGGPLISTKGEVIGINTLVYENPTFNTQGLGFAIPSNTAKQVITKLLTVAGEAWSMKPLKPKVRLGLGLFNLSEELALQFGLPVVHGIVVESVEPDSPAAKAQFAAGDVLTKVDGKDIKDTEFLAHYLQQKSPGTVVTFELWRKGLKGLIRVKLEAATP